MTWTKAKVAIMAGLCVLLTTGTTAIIIYNQEKPLQSIPKDWSALSGDIDDWTWANGKIMGHCTNGESILASGKEYRDVTLSAIASSTNREASLAIRMQDSDNGYIIIFAPSGTLRDDAGHISLVKRLSGSETTLASYQGRVFSSMGQSAKIAVAAKGSWLKIQLNDVTVLRVKDTTFTSGFVGFRIYGNAEYPCDATFSKVTF